MNDDKRTPPATYVPRPPEKKPVLYLPDGTELVMHKQPAGFRPK